MENYVGVDIFYYSEIDFQMPDLFQFNVRIQVFFILPKRYRHLLDDNNGRCTKQLKWIDEYIIMRA